jgi:hypothetical protein
MYKIYKENRAFTKALFDSYEEARKAARRYQTAILGYYLDNISDYGFSIKKVV